MNPLRSGMSYLAVLEFYDINESPDALRSIKKQISVILLVRQSSVLCKHFQLSK